MKGWVLVTGAAKRIGRAIALDLATHGWDVIVHYHRSQDEARAVAETIQVMGRNACLAEFDLARSDLLENLIPSLAEELGMIDGLINNAALFEPDDQDPDGSRHWAVNAEAPRILCKSFRDHLPKNEHAAIVNLLDDTPIAGNFTAYGKSKEFLTQITRNMAKSFAPQVRVNGVAPAYVLPSPRQTDESFRALAGGNMVTAEDVACAVRKCLDITPMTGELISVRSLI